MVEKSTYFGINNLAHYGYNHKICRNHARANGIESDLEPRTKIQIDRPVEYPIQIDNQQIQGIDAINEK